MTRTNGTIHEHVTGKADRGAMRITALRVHAIAIGDPPLRSSYGLHAPFALRTILELESAAGVVGISEAHGGEANARKFESLRDRVVGADPWQLCGSLLGLIERIGEKHTNSVPDVDAKRGKKASRQTVLFSGCVAFETHLR